MQTYQLYQLLGQAIWLLFVFAFGACAGSLINVLVYRLPRGIGVVTPPSRCPACETRLTWRENIPVFGWLFLGGKCRFCKSRISAEYPLVEAFVGGLLAVTFYLWYMVPSDATFFGIAVGHIRPEWAMVDARDGWPRESWPEFVSLALLMALLVAMTLTDVKTSTIPIQLPWVTAIIGLVFHVGYAIYLSATDQRPPWRIPDWIWPIPTPGGNPLHLSSAWWWIGASIGAVIGLGIAVVLLERGLIRRSFADYHDWEAEALKGVSPAPVLEPDLKPTDERRPPARLFGPVCAFITTLIACAITGWAIGQAVGGERWIGLLVGVLGAPIAAGVVFHRLFPGPAAPVDTGLGDPSMWIQYPHARREMVKELLFLTPCLFLAVVGGWLGVRFGTGGGAAGHQPALWLLVLAGVLMGYLIGGGVVWAFRIGGSLAFGKEAMGLGDVHMMAGVGACLGWIDATLALPLAAVVGLYWAIASALSGGGLRRTMPFGPYLAVATLLLVFAKPLVEVFFTRLLGIVPPTPSVNLP